MFATPNTLRNVIADLQFYSKFGTDNEITITIEDFDDGDGPMMVGSRPGKLRAQIKVGIFAAPPSLPPGATTEMVYAKEVTLVLKAGGTVEEYEAKADSVKERLRQQLRCFLPTCTLTVTVEAGSVILTVVATDTVGAASEVESAAVALQEKRLDVMSSVLGITIEEVPAAPSARAVQVQVMRLAPSPPPPSPDAGVSATNSDSAATQDAGPGLAIGLALGVFIGVCLLVGVLAAAVFVWHRKCRMQTTVAQPESQKV